MNRILILILKTVVTLSLFTVITVAEDTKILKFGSHLTFGDIVVGESTTKELILYNRGNSDLSISKLSFHERLRGVYNGNFTGIIPAGGEQMVPITFTPNDNRSYVGLVYVHSDKTNGGDRSRLLRGSGVNDVLDDPEVVEETRILKFGSHLNFGDVIIGESTTRELTLYNKGNSDLTIDKLSFHDKLKGAYTGSFSGVIPASGEKNVTITFTPNDNSSYVGLVYVHSDRTNGGDKNRLLKGNGIEAPQNPCLTRRELLYMIWDGEDVSDANISCITDMSYMFESFGYFYDRTGYPANNSDISNWDVSHVTNMTGMFHGNYLFNRDISDWNVSNVTTMKEMFSGAMKFNQDISSWDVSNVTDMDHMFGGKDAIYARAFNQDISDWNVSNVVNMDGMFFHATAFNQDISSWNVSNDVSHKDFNSRSSLENIHNPFYLTTEKGITHLKIEAYARSNGENNDVPTIEDYVKLGVLGVTVNNLDDINDLVAQSNVNEVDSVVELNLLVRGLSMNTCITREELEVLIKNEDDVTGVDTSCITDMSSLFSYDPEGYPEDAPFNQDIGDWNVSNVTNMGSMFAENRQFNQDISSWEVSNVTNMDFMFFENWQFNQDISSWDISNVITHVGFVDPDFNSLYNPFPEE